MVLPLLAAGLLIAADPTPQAATSPAASTWYGWQTLAVDGAAAALMGGAVIMEGSPAQSAAAALAIPGVVLYFVGPPVVHWRHGRGLATMLDLGLRVLIPAAAGIAGVGFEVITGNLAQFASAGVWGLLVVGPLVAVALDAVSLAWESPPPAQPEHASVQWTPFLGAARGSPVAGVAGRF